MNIKFTTKFNDNIDRFLEHKDNLEEFTEQIDNKIRIFLKNKNKCPVKKTDVKHNKKLDLAVLQTFSDVVSLTRQYDCNGEKKYESDVFATPKSLRIMHNHA